jgi:hypothetical protein
MAAKLLAAGRVQIREEKIWIGEDADMTVDDILLKALEDGPVTVNDILKRFERRVRIRLNRLHVRGVVTREGRGGAHREFTYRLLRPELAAKALAEKGGGLALRKVTQPEQP